MKLADIPVAITALDAELDTINAQRDALAVKAKALAEQRKRLAYALKAFNDTPPALRPHVLGALGIESSERVNGQ